MSYTKEFEEWVHTDEVSAKYLHDWLSAFARLVREEAMSAHSQPVLLAYLGNAFNTICERFGLEKK